jgi:nucleotidyltransferase/DNA polymerase involved in DNA repair
MNFACLYIPDFHAQAVIRSEPSLRNRAVALVEREPPPFRVFAANEAARKAGADCGMSRVEVAAIQGVEVRQRSQAAEASTQAALLDLAQSFSPRFEHVTADTVVLDLAGLEALLGTAEEVARRLAAQAQELGLVASVALAANPDAARIAARGFTGITIIGEGKEAERLGKLPVETLDLSPDMQETLARWGIRTFSTLAALPAAELSERLGQEGIRLQTLARGGSLRALVPAGEPLHFEEAMDLEDPVAELEPLAFILGRLLNQLCARLSARGRATEELRLAVELEGGHEDRQVEERNSKLETRKSKFEIRNSKLENQDSKFTRPESGIRNSGHEKVGTRSRKAGRARRPSLGRENVLASVHRGRSSGAAKTNVDSLRVSNFDFRVSTCEFRVLRLPVPTRDSRLLLKLWMLELEAHPPSAPVLKLAITAEPTRPRVAQGDLFLPQAPDPQKLELTLARLRGVVGEGKAGSPELLDTHRPDAFLMAPFGESKIEARSSKDQSPKIHPSKSRSVEFRFSLFDLRSSFFKFQTTLRLFRPPIEASVEMQNGRPVRLESHRVRGRIVSAAGPWRTSGGWWTDNPWEHDEWDVEVRSVVRRPLSVTGANQKSHVERKGLYCIFQDQVSRKWLINGTYD